MGSQNDFIKRVKTTFYRCEPKRSQSDSLEGDIMKTMMHLLTPNCVTLSMITWPKFLDLQYSYNIEDLCAAHIVHGSQQHWKYYWALISPQLSELKSWLQNVGSEVAWISRGLSVGVNKY